MIKTEYSSEELNEIGITVKNDDVVCISGDLYVKTPEALERVLAELKDIGYDIKSNREDDGDKSWYGRDVTIEEKEKNGYSLWYASLKDIRTGKCGFCNSYITTRGIKCHGRTCENCGELIYEEVTDGGTIKFLFRNQKFHMGIKYFIFETVSWDIETGDLLLYLDSCSLKGWGDKVTGVEALQELEKYQDRWEILDGGIIKVKRYRSFDDRRGEMDIETHDTYGSRSNAKIVKLWKGEEYAEYFSDFPIPESMSIYETWHWGGKWPLSSKLHNKVISAAGQVSDKSYYYQDGRCAFGPIVFQRMERFIDHFTELPVEKFTGSLRNMRKDGPGFIDDLAALCSGDEIPEVTNTPNMFNTLMAVHSIASGKNITPGEIDAAMNGLNDGNLKPFLGGW